MSEVKMMEVKLSQNHMATTFHFTIMCELSRYLEAETALEKAHALVDLLEKELTEFNEISPVYQLNHSAEPVCLSRSGVELFQLSQLLSRATDRAFDPTIKTKSEMFPRFDCQPETGKITKLVPDAQLSFGAIGKGYALDRVKLLLESWGFKNYLLNAGGSSLVISGEWRWAWAWKKNLEGEYQGTELSHSTSTPIAIGVSGSLEQGQHIFTSQKRFTSTVNELQSTLVAHPSAAVADALSTALYVSGWDSGRELIASIEPPCAIAAIDRQGTASYNGVFKELWGALCLCLLSISLFFSHTITALADENAEQAIDLGSMGGDRFNPYLYERNWLWVLLPLVSLLLVFLHLKKTKKNPKGYFKTGDKK